MDAANGELLERFRNIILSYNQQRASDPFMQWFREHDRQGFFANDFERILIILIDARFDQQTTAEKALENTKHVFQVGVLRKQLSLDEIPELVAKKRMAPEKWRSLFYEALSKLKTLAAKIEEKRDWTAEELLDLMSSSNYRVPYLAVKTSRLAVRWLHELVPHLRIDMSGYKIPVDSLVYRVSSRLGIIDPHKDEYAGNESPADLKIQEFVKTLFPNDPWFLDEPLWSTGRQPVNKGHCFPTRPDCYGCIFEKICPRKYTDFDPSTMGMVTDQKAASQNGNRYPRKIKPLGPTEEQKKFSEFVQRLKDEGVTGEEYRRRIMEWSRNKG